MAFSPATIALLSAVLLGFSAVSSTSVAQKQDKPLSATVFIETRYDDNANRVSNGKTLSEQQNFYGLSLLGDYRNANSRFFLNYSARREEYTEESQPNDTTIFGQSGFSAANSVETVGIDVSHNQTRLLDDPTDDQRTVNTSGQSALTVRPYLSSVKSKRGALKLTGIFSDLSYDSDLREDYTESGAELEYARDINAVRTAGIRAQSSRFDFDENADINYRQTELAIFFQTQLRTLGYGIDLGSRKLVLDESEEEEEAPFYKLSIDYSTDGTTISFLSETQFANTSSFQSVQQIDSSIAVGTEAGEADRLDVQTNQIQVRKNSFHGSRIVFLYNVRDIDFLNLKENNSSISSIQLGVFYPTGPKSEIGIDVSRRKIEFDSRSKVGSTSDNIRIRYERRIFRRLNAALSYQSRKQSFEDDEIDSSIVLLNLSYLVR